MSQPERLVYTAKTRTTGGREGGVSRSSDGRLEVKLSPPGGPAGGTNPEQLLASGWSACFASSMAAAGRMLKVALPIGTAVDAEIDLVQADSAGFFLRARLAVHLPGMDPEVARSVIDEAHRLCPFSRALRGNVEVDIRLT